MKRLHTLYFRFVSKFWREGTCKIGVKEPGSGTRLYSQHSEGRSRWIFVSSRSAWSEHSEFQYSQRCLKRSWKVGEIGKLGMVTHPSQVYIRLSVNWGEDKERRKKTEGKAKKELL